MNSHSAGNVPDKAQRCRDCLYRLEKTYESITAGRWYRCRRGGITREHGWCARWIGVKGMNRMYVSLYEKTDSVRIKSVGATVVAGLGSVDQEPDAWVDVANEREAKFGILGKFAESTHVIIQLPNDQRVTVEVVQYNKNKAVLAITTYLVAEVVHIEPGSPK